MHDDDLKKALDDFLQQRIDNCGARDNEGLQEAYQQFERCIGKLKSSLTPEQKQVYLDLENACSLLDGETQNCYYRAGFSDAVVFFMGWRDGKWN